MFSKPQKFRSDDGATVVVYQDPKNPVEQVTVFDKVFKPVTPEEYICPFCKTDCPSGWDCSCGAKAIASALWRQADKPLMRTKTLSDDSMIFLLMAGVADGRIREMIPNPDFTK